MFGVAAPGRRRTGGRHRRRRRGGRRGDPGHIADSQRQPLDVHELGAGRAAGPGPQSQRGDGVPAAGAARELHPHRHSRIGGRGRRVGLGRGKRTPPTRTRDAART